LKLVPDTLTVAPASAGLGDSVSAGDVNGHCGVGVGLGVGLAVGLGFGVGVDVGRGDDPEVGVGRVEEDWRKSECSGVANSVDTCQKQLRALHAALKRNPELWNAAGAIKRRLASAKLELALSRLNAGERAAGFGTLLQAVAADPAQLKRVAHLGRGRLRRIVASA